MAPFIWQAVEACAATISPSSRKLESISVEYCSNIGGIVQEVDVVRTIHILGVIEAREHIGDYWATLTENLFTELLRFVGCICAC